jgi:uncharacterized membrane-anchored protein YitT (DUF2179 family)
MLETLKIDIFKKLILVTIGLVFTAIGIKILALSKLTFGGTAGIGTILSYGSDYSWGFWFFIVNIPFFIISFQQLGKWFTLSSFMSISAISIIRDSLDFIVLPEINTLIASVLAGIFVGIGITLVLNNGSSLGGIHILALFLDQKLKINRGVSIFVCDSLIVVISALMIGWSTAFISIISIFIASSIVGRYKKSPIKEMQEETSPVPQSTIRH